MNVVSGIATILFVGVIITLNVFAPLIYAGFVTYNFDELGDGTDSPTGQEIRIEVEQIAQNIANGTWSGIYEISVTEIKSGLSADQFISYWQQYAKSKAGIENIEIVEIFVADLEDQHLMGSAYSIPPIVPSEVLPPAVSLSSPIVGHQAFILCKAVSDNRTLPTWISIILKRQEARWHFVQLLLSPAEVGGHGGKWFWEKARQFETNGQNRNAYFYSRIAHELLVPSAAIVPIAASDIQLYLQYQEPQNLPFPGLRPAEKWKISDELTVSVEYVGTVMSGVMLWLEVRYQTALANVESENAKFERKQVYEYVVRNFPEYEFAFGGIYVGSVQESGRGNRDGFPFDESGPSLIPKWNDKPRH